MTQVISSTFWVLKNQNMRQMCQKAVHGAKRPSEPQEATQRPIVGRPVLLPRLPHGLPHPTGDVGPQHAGRVTIKF